MFLINFARRPKRQNFPVYCDVNRLLYSRFGWRRLFYECKCWANGRLRENRQLNILNERKTIRSDKPIQSGCFWISIGFCLPTIFHAIKSLWAASWKVLNLKIAEEISKNNFSWNFFFSTWFIDFQHQIRCVFFAFVFETSEKHEWRRLFECERLEAHINDIHYANIK